MEVLFEEGGSRIEKIMNIGKIIKDIKYLKLLTRFKIDPDLETKFQIHHCSKNIIDIDKIWNEIQNENNHDLDQISIA